MKKETSKISPLLSFLPLLVLIVLLFSVVKVFGADAMSGATQMALIIATAVCVGIALWKKVKWENLESEMSRQIFNVAPSIIILLLIGALSGIWMVSGVVPILICYGIDLIHPSVFLASACTICAIISVMTGSSWTTIATVGIALMGVGNALGYSEGWTAGAIISGAYFGDKISPLSDTTVLASSSSDTPLFVHIRYMLFTTVPAFLLSVVIFTVVGLFFDVDEQTTSIEQYSQIMCDTFNLNPWLLVVPISTGVLIAKKVPAAITIFLSALMASVFALIFQMDNLICISGETLDEYNELAVSLKGLLMSLYGQTSLESGSDIINNLIQTRGMAGMLNTIWLIMCAVIFGGCLKGSGMLDSITGLFIKKIKGTVGLVGSTVASGLFLNLSTSDQYTSIVLNCEMYKHIYIDKGYETRLLSRTTEDAVTVTSVLIPWNTCGMVQSTVLGVATWVYLPFCLFNILSPLVTLVIAILGYNIKIKKSS